MILLVWLFLVASTVRQMGASSHLLKLHLYMLLEWFIFIHENKILRIGI